MKRPFAVLTVIVLSGFLINLSAQDFLMTEQSAFRLQNRFTGGIELCTAPSGTAADTRLVPTSFKLKAGYRIKSTYIIGLMGIEYMNDENFIPLGIELRQNFTSNPWAPYVYAQTGYSLHLKRNIRSRYYTANYAQYDPSWFINAGVGYSFATTLSEFYISAGFLYHQLEEVMVEQTGEIRTDLTMKGVALTLGFLF
jgi:hypothetical protein